MATAPLELIQHRLAHVDPDRLVRLVGSWNQPALLESGPQFGEGGRWSLYTAEPRLCCEVTEQAWRISGQNGSHSGTDDDPFERLNEMIERFGLASRTRDAREPLPPFTGGLVGFFGYDLAPRLERLPRKAPRDSRIPDLRFALYDTVVSVDHLTGSVDLWARDLLGEGDALLEARLEHWRSRLESSSPAPDPPPSRLSPVVEEMGREAYLSNVRSVLDYIAAGDIFQANLTHRFSARGEPEPLDLYLRLRARSPAPFSAYLKWDDLAIVSASPEWFYEVRGDRITTRPIKGTRPRGTSAEDDQRLAQELASSSKDRAELTMIVDLERNDLGRVCRFGSVRVREALTVESFAQVHHLVATVEGDSRGEARPIDVVKALFPGGSITGAPKIRAMQIIDELEPTRRSLYTGAIGYFGTGTTAFNIAIRTLLVEGDRVTYQVGGGIVADSDPESEYRETLDKGRALREVLESCRRVFS